MRPCIVTNFFIIKPTRCTDFTNLLRHETLHISGRSSVHHQEFIHCTLGTVYVTQVLRQLSSRTRIELVPSWSCSKAVFKPVWQIPSSGVYSLYTQHCTCHTGLKTAFEQDQDRTSSILVLLESCLQTCMTYTIAECTVNKFLMMGRGKARNM